MKANEIPQVELLQRDVKILFDENRELKEEVKRYEKALKKIRLIPWPEVMDSPQIAFEALKGRGINESK